MRALSFIEIDVSRCSLSYGVPPCMATGEVKCFNTISTCQDRLHYSSTTETLRFSVDTLDLPQGIDSIPCIQSINYTPGTISLGGDLGIRTSLAVSFSEFPYSDAGLAGDPYWEERGYDPYKVGTFWSKFRARQPYLRGRAIRYIQGRVGQTLEEMDTRHFIIDSFTGPDAMGRYSIVGKDVLKLTDGDRSQAPRLSSGFLISGIGPSDGSMQLAPSGIGDLEYPSSGYIAIGGREICAFSRSGDTFSLSRGQYNTDAVSHEAQDRAQTVLIYNAMSVADIIRDLLVNYAENFQSTWINLPTWQDEVDTHLRRLYTGILPEPTDVGKLISEIIEQAALALWWDDLARQVRLQVLRPLIPVSDLTPEVYVEDSFTVADQPGTRVSEVWTYYGQINPLKSVTDTDNYRSARVDVDLEAITDHGTNSIKKIMGRWIPAFGAQVATRVNQITLSRFRENPRKLSVSMYRDYDEAPQLGAAHNVYGRTIQDAAGFTVPVLSQITRIHPGDSTWDLTLEEALFTQVDVGDLSNRVITIDGMVNNVNLRSLHDNIYPPPDEEDPPTLKLIISRGVYVWSARDGFPALDIGSWPAFMSGRISLQVDGIIQGRGGQGAPGRGGDDAGGYSGYMGSTGLLVRFPTLINIGSTGRVRGGGGGGGGGGADYMGWFGPQRNGAGGGGGAGRGAGGSPTWPAGAGGAGSLDSGGGGGENGIVEYGSGRGAGDYAGAGGAPGSYGSSAGGPYAGAGGPPGYAVDGWGYLTQGTISGSYVGPVI